jgi:hypothetical protein
MAFEEKKIWVAIGNVATLFGVRPESIPQGEDRKLLLAYIEECYSEYSPEEFERAFRYALAEKFEAETNCYGDFNGRFIANILNAYRKWMKAEAKEQIKNQPMQQPPQSEMKEDLSDKAMQDWWRQLKQQVCGDKNYDVFFIPPMIYDWLDKKNMIRVTNNIRWMYFRRGVDLRRMILFKNSEEHGSAENVNRFKEFCAKQAVGKIPGEEVENVKILAKKILLLDLIRSGQMWNIDFSENENAGRRRILDTPFLPPDGLNKAVFMYDWYMSPSEG